MRRIAKAAIFLMNIIITQEFYKTEIKQLINN